VLKLKKYYFNINVGKNYIHQQNKERTHEYIIAWALGLEVFFY
jgi:hypothetical protein